MFLVNAVLFFQTTEETAFSESRKRKIKKEKLKIENSPPRTANR